MDEQQTPSPRRRGALAAVLAAVAIGALAVPALASSGDSGSSGSSGATEAAAPGFVQDEEQQPRDERPDGQRDRDCPEKDGERGGGGGGSAGGGSTNPGVEF
jgi:hypothetical protein